MVLKIATEKATHCLIFSPLYLYIGDNIIIRLFIKHHGISIIYVELVMFLKNSI